MSPPFRKANFEIIYGQGISREGEIVDLGVKHGIIEKSGAWYSYNQNRLGQGKDNVRSLLEEDKAMAQEIEQKIQAIMMPTRQQEGQDEEV